MSRKLKCGGLSYLLAAVLTLYITVKLLASFESVAYEFKGLLVDTNKQTIYIDQNYN